MNRTVIADIFNKQSDYFDKTITVCGWIKTVRSSKNIGFIMISDGSGIKPLQIVVESNIENFAEIMKCSVGCSISVDGMICATPHSAQKFEMKATEISVLGESSPDYPLQKKRHSLEYLRTIGHLRPRANTFTALYRLRSGAAFAIHEFFNKNGFIYAHTPIITGSDAEGAGDMFRVTTLDAQNSSVNSSDDFFGKAAHLTVSGQLEGECMALAFSKIYTFGPTFRAEKSYTARHAAEFWMVEPEIAFAELSDDMALAEDMLKYVIKYLLTHYKDELEFFDAHYDSELINRLTALIKSNFAHITYTQAIEILLKSKVEFEYPVKWGCDLQTEHERFLCESVYNGPLFVTDYPAEIKAFYMRRNDDGKTVAAMDLLVPSVGEIIGGSQREERLDVLENVIKSSGFCCSDYSWYIDLRRFGSVKHAGFGLGFERLIMYVTGMSNIRDVLPFPRTTGSCEF